MKRRLAPTIKMAYSRSCFLRKSNRSRNKSESRSNFMIRFDKLTLKGQEALQAAQSHAQEKSNPQITPEHLLLALIEQKEGIVLPILQKLGVNLQTFAQQLAEAVGKLPQVQGQAEVNLNPALNRVLEDAFKEA